MLFMTAPSPPAPFPSPGASTGHALEWHAPTLTRIDERTTIPALLQARVSRSADRPLIARKQGTNEVWRTITAREFSEEVDAVASGLIGMGMEPGERVAIMSRTRYEWTLLDFACWTAALVPVPSTRRARPSRSPTSSPIPRPASSSPRRSPCRARSHGRQSQPDERA